MVFYVCSFFCIMYNDMYVCILLTLGAHAQRGYLSVVCVFVGVIEEKGRERGRKESDQTQTQ